MKHVLCIMEKDNRIIVVIIIIIKFNLIQFISLEPLRIIDKIITILVMLN
jgi:hypothetical protein